MKSLFVCLFSSILLAMGVRGQAFTYSECTNSQQLNPADLSCDSCATNLVANNYQTVPIVCQCATGYVSSTAGACSSLSYGPCGGTNNNYYPVYNLDGSSNIGSACVACDSTAYPNSNATECISCGPGMTYGSQGCECSTTGQIPSHFGCYTSTLSPSVQPSYVHYTKLAYLFPGCGTYSDPLSCSQLSNLCAYSQGSSSAPECQFFTTNSLTNLLHANSSDFSISFSKDSALDMKLISYLPTGNYLGQRTLQLADLIRCGTPANLEVPFTMGSNYDVTCNYNFNNLVRLLNSKQQKGRVYQMLVKGGDGNYYDVAVYMPGSTQAIKRFFLQDDYTQSNKLTVMTGFTLSFTLDDGGSLTDPRFKPTYTQLTTEAGIGVTGSSADIELEYMVEYTSSLSGFWVGAFVSFGIMSLVAILHAALKTYIDYLNRRSVVRFMLNLANTFSMWLFYYLLCFSGYWFLFTKTTSSAFLLLPLESPSLYGAFYGLVGLMFALRIMWALIDKGQKLSTEVFLINWQPSQFRNSWREIFIVNSLAQFYSYRTVSLFWMLFVVMFFTNGVGWETLSASTATTQVFQIYSTLTPRNRIFNYFLGCAIFLAVGIVFKILRRISVMFWPYPFQDFVDYCTVCNISFLFMKKNLPHAYYLHAALPERSEVTYKEINQAIRRGQQKSRSIGNEMGERPQDSLRLYSIYLSREVTQRHAELVSSLESQEEADRTKFATKKVKGKKINYREQFNEKVLKPYLEAIPNPENDRRQKTLVQSFCGAPPVDLRQQGVLRGRSQVFKDSQLQLLNQVFPNGNQFQEIHTFIVVFVAWVALVNSIPIAAFLTYLVDSLIGWWVEASCRTSLEEMTRVKKGFMI